MSDDEIEAELSNLVDLVDEFEKGDRPERGKDVQLTIVRKKGETVEQGKARAALSSEYHAAASIFQLSQILSSKDVDLTELANRLEYQTQQIKNGDLTQAEFMLSSQAHTLDALFHHLLTRAALNMGNEFNVVERLFKLAMKAQSQSRTTWDSLASMKNPTVLMCQTNIAHGHQQVNNIPTQEQEIDGDTSERDLKNELLEKTDGERLDFGKAATPIRRDQDVEAVGEVDGSKNDSGQGNSIAERK